MAPRGGGVDRDRTFGDEAEQVMRPARLRPRARQPLAAEGLRSHHRADHRAVDVEIADMRVRLGHLGGARAAAVEPHRQPEAFRSEEHPSELQSLTRNSYAVFCSQKHTYNEH